MAELTTLAGALRHREAKVFAYHQRPSNGPTEAMNLLITLIKRLGFGFRNFDNYWLRRLLHCGIEWNAPKTARIRGRDPRSAA